MTTTTKKSFTSKRGLTILKGERVTVSFNVRGKKSISRPTAVQEFLPNYIRLTTADGRTIITRNFRFAGIRVPSMRQLERWVCDSVCDSVFGNQVEPDGWDSEGSPSWLLAFGLV